MTLDDLDAICVVCYRALGPKPPTLGGRTYCEEHITMLAQDRPSLWRTLIGQAIALPILLITVLILTQVIGLQINETLRLPVSMMLAVLPGLLWLVMLLWEERQVGGNIQYLPTVVVLGALMAAAVGLPFLERVVNIESWLPASAANARFLGNILLVGPTHMFLIYATVRYTALRTPVFERRADGLLYTVATAIGYATMLNIQLVARSGGFDPANGIFRIIGDVVGHAGAAAVLGFFLGQHRFEDFSPWFLPAGLALAAFVDGTFVYARAEVTRTGLGLVRDAFSPWPGLAMSFFIAAASFVIIYGLLRRINTLTLLRMESHDFSG